MYKIGDFVVYRQLSVCKIEGVSTPSFEVDKTKQYYTLSPAFDNKSNTVIYVPLDSLDGLRPLLTSKEASALLKELPKIKPVGCIFKKPPQVTAYYQELLLSTDFKRYLACLKDVRSKEKSGKKLSEIEIRYRNKLEKLLSEEFALALEKTPEEMRKQIQENLQ